ncbi:MAG: MFS transporter, partial [Candidatus Aenigmatarchaeota archaeon]
MEKENYSKLDSSSYGMGAFIQQFFRMAFTSLGFHFYEVVIGLDPWYTAIGYVIFALWNAINDPLIGYLTSKPYSFTRKLGRFFPWILIGGIPWILSYVLIYLPPTGGEIIFIFIWLIFTTCLFDTFNSFFFVNFQALFPSKFRSNEIRRNASGIVTVLGVVGIALGALVPPLLISYESAESYISQGVIISIIGTFLFLLGIYGWREDQPIIDEFLESYEEKRQDASYFTSLKAALKVKSFLAFLILYMFWQVVTYSVQTSIVYVVDLVLQRPSLFQTLIQAMFLIGSVASIPFWLKYSHKTNNNKKVMLIGSSLMAIFTATLTFFPNLIVLFIQIILWGISLGAVWLMLKPIMADIVDEAVVTTEVREESVFYGI